MMKNIDVTQRCLFKATEFVNCIMRRVSVQSANNCCVEVFFTQGQAVHIEKCKKVSVLIEQKILNYRVLQ